MEKRKWTAAQLRRQLPIDLRECTTDLERQCCLAICEKEIRQAEDREAKQRSLSGQGEPCHG